MGIETEYEFDFDRELAAKHDWVNILSPASVRFENEHFVMNGQVGKVFYIHEYPKSLESDIISALSKMNCTSYITVNNKSVVSAPPGQQAQRFLHDALRYCIILYIAANMWSIMGYIIDFTDGITGKISATSGYTLSVSGDMEKIIEDCLKLPSFELSGEWLEKFWSTIGCSLLFLIGGIVLLFIMVASCLSIISSAFQRILKPLMILPFAGIAIALGAGGHDISRSL